MKDWESRNARSWLNDTDSIVSDPTEDGAHSLDALDESTLVTTPAALEVTGPAQSPLRPTTSQILNPSHEVRNTASQSAASRRGPSIIGTLPNASAAARPYLPPAGLSSPFPRSTSNPQMGNRRSRVNNGTGSGESSADSGENVDPRSRWQPQGDTNKGRNRAATQAGTLRESARARTLSTRPLAKDLWAEPVGLVTTKRAAYNEYTTRTTQEREQYLRPPPADESFPSTGIYIWPYRKQTPIDLFGSKLAPLAAVRREYQIFIQSVTTPDNIQYLRVSSRDCKADLTPVFDGIRRAVQDAKARKISASPTFIFVPPTAKAMRKIVRPEVYQTLYPMKAKDFVLSGDFLPPQERLSWQLDRPGMVAKNQQLLQTTLIAGLKNLEPLKGWMRMRVTFGHVEVKKFQTPFADGQYSFEQFVKMVDHPRQDSVFEKKIGGSETAIKLCDKIVGWPAKFVPANGRTKSLSDVKFKDTAILFIKTNTGQELRLEAEIDRLYEQEQSEFQAGSVRLFIKEKTHRSLNITVIDVERQLDWQLEVITDSEQFEVPSPLYALIKESISVKSKVRKDCHGLEYPEVTPSKYNKSDFRIETVVVRSVIQYKFLDSDFFVELAIFREWDGANTTGEPIMKASVSMFHPEWDTHMESIEHTTRIRDFGPGLANLFNYQTEWLVPFLDEIAFTQGLLVDVARALKAEAALKIQVAVDRAVAAPVRAAKELMAQYGPKA
ncbi:hypothetical protein BKA65DRAFT_481536 [Rhexocercosporidium sp. MPI-PUGE-AT-0058]|nr:hypothetical protein BKA65DRAFT_481536 [Rhexocercosporidium sp. MPI-PUGE-AT-0058]